MYIRFMTKYTPSFIAKARALRTEGKTYQEICEILKKPIPKATLSGWVKGIVPPHSYYEKLVVANLEHLARIQAKSVIAAKKKRKRYFEGLHKRNVPIAKEINSITTAKIALAILCLGEASKYKHGSRFCLGNTDPRVITLFLHLLYKCYDFQMNKLRCRVQCRADQDILVLEKYWQKVTGIPKELFNKAWVDKRTIGKPTRREGYMGVLAIDYYDVNVQHDLESLAEMLYIHVCNEGP